MIGGLLLDTLHLCVEILLHGEARSKMLSLAQVQKQNIEE